MVPLTTAAERRADARKKEGNEEFRKGNYALALSIYDESLQQCPDYLPALSNRVACHLALGNIDECIRDASAVIAKEPRNVKALMRRAMAYEMMNDRSKGARLAYADYSLVHNDTQKCQLSAADGVRRMRARIDEADGEDSTSARHLRVVSQRTLELKSSPSENISAPAVTFSGYLYKQGSG